MVTSDAVLTTAGEESRAAREDAVDTPTQAAASSLPRVVVHGSARPLSHEVLAVPAVEVPARAQ